MANKHRCFVAHTKGVLDAQVLCGFGINREDSGRVEVEELKRLKSYGLRQGQKNVVQDIRRLSPEDGKQRWQIIAQNDRKFILRTGPTTYFPAGGALNMAFVLRQFGFVRPAIIGPSGRGSGGADIIAAIQEHNIPYALWPAEGTAFTLSVQDPDGASTLFLVKPAEHLESNAAAYLAKARPDIIVTNSVRKHHVPFVRRLYAAMPKAKKVFAPHVELLQQSDASWMDLIPGVDYFQINRREASLVVKTRFHPVHLPEVVKLGAKRTVITLEEAGAIMALDGQPPLKQVALPVQPRGTNGAGDAFMASMINDLLVKGLDPALALRRAVIVAGKKVESVCPWGGIPSEEERKMYLELLD